MNRTLSIIALGLVVIVGEFAACQIVQLSMAHDAGYCYRFTAENVNVAQWMPCGGP